MSIKTMVVGRVVYERDRVLIYPEIEDRWHYRVIADSKATDIRIGDTIRYEPYGANFGWHVRDES